MEASTERVRFLVRKLNNNTIVKEEIIELKNLTKDRDLVDRLGRAILPITVKELKENKTYSAYNKLHWFERSQLLRNKETYKRLLIDIAVEGLRQVEGSVIAPVYCDFEMTANHSRQEERINVEIVEAGVIGSGGELLNSYIKADHTLPLRVVKMFGITQDKVDNGISKSELIDKLYTIAKEHTLIVYGDYDITVLETMSYLDNEKVKFILSKMYNISPLIALILNLTVQTVSKRNSSLSWTNKAKYYQQLKGNVSLMYLNAILGIPKKDSHTAIGDSLNLAKVLISFFSKVRFGEGIVKFNTSGEDTYNENKIRSILLEGGYELINGKLADTLFVKEDKIFDEILDTQKATGKYKTIEEQEELYSIIKERLVKEEAERKRKKEEKERNRRERQSYYGYDVMTLGDLDPECVPPNWFFD